MQVQYVFLHQAILDGITSVWTDIPVDQLSKRMAELSEENEEGDSGFTVEFNVRKRDNNDAKTFPPKNIGQCTSLNALSSSIDISHSPFKYLIPTAVVASHCIM